MTEALNVKPWQRDKKRKSYHYESSAEAKTLTETAIITNGGCSTSKRRLLNDYLRFYFTHNIATTTGQWPSADSDFLIKLQLRCYCFGSMLPKGHLHPLSPTHTVGKMHGRKTATVQLQMCRMRARVCQQISNIHITGRFWMPNVLLLSPSGQEIYFTQVYIHNRLMFVLTNISQDEKSVDGSTLL